LELVQSVITFLEVNTDHNTVKAELENRRDFSNCEDPGQIFNVLQTIYNDHLSIKITYILSSVWSFLKG